MNLDIGNNARIEKIVISPAGLRISARTLISSKKNRIIDKRARFFYDLGDFVSQFLGFYQPKRNSWSEPPSNASDIEG